MIVNKKSLGVGLLLCTIVSEGLSKNKEFKNVQKKSVVKREKPMHTITPQKVNGLMRKFFIDTYTIGERIFTLQSMKILSAVVPFYLIGRKTDPIIHRQFYDAQNHKNIHQPPKWLVTMLDDEMMAVPFGIYGVYGFYVKAKG